MSSGLSGAILVGCFLLYSTHDTEGSGWEAGADFKLPTVLGQLTPPLFIARVQAVGDLNSGLATLRMWGLTVLILLLKLQLVSWFPEGAFLFQKFRG